MREAFPVVREGSGGPPKGPGGIGRSSRGRVGAGRPFQRSVRPSLRSRRDPEAPVKVREDLPEVREGLGGPFGGPVGGGRPSRRTRRSREVLKDREGSGGSPRGLGGVGWPSRRSGMSRVALPQVWDGSGVPPAGPGGVGRPSQRFGWGEKAFPKVREALPEF